MKEHTSRVHEGTKPFLCDSCEESFAKDSKLKLHIKGMQGGESSKVLRLVIFFNIEEKHKSQNLTASEV